MSDPFSAPQAADSSSLKIGEVPAGEKSNSKVLLLKGKWKSKMKDKNDLNHFYSLAKTSNEMNKFITEKGNNHAPLF